MMKILISGQEISSIQIEKWEATRVLASVKYLEKKLNEKINVKNADELAKYKCSLSEEVIRKQLRSDLRFVAFLTGMAVRHFGKKRKVSVTEIEVDFCNAQKLYEMYNDMMLNNTEDNKYSCLRANPDHYIVRGAGGDSQEVIEVTGGVPFPSEFLIQYNDFNGLVSKQEDIYPLQAAGASYLKNGICIGAVRHQMRDTELGCKVKLSVEFPAFLPRKNIEAHERHLAIEFYNWFSKFERRIKGERQ